MSSIRAFRNLPSTSRARSRSMQKAARSAVVSALRTRSVGRLGEVKRRDFALTSLGFNSISNSWIEADLVNAVTTGATFNNRIGAKIRLLGVKVYGVLQNSYNAATPLLGDSYNNVRMVAHINEQPNIQPLFTSGLTMDENINPGRNTGITKTLLDKYIPLYPPITLNTTGTGLVAGPTAKIVKHFFKMPAGGLECSFGGAAGPRPTFYLSFVSDSAAPAHPGFVTGYATIYYTDM